MGPVLDYTEYPGLDPEVMGIYPNSGYGTVGGMRCHGVESGVAATLCWAASVTDTILNVENASNLPEPPIILQAGVEQMRLETINGNTITVTRGHDGTMISAHPAGRMLYEVRDRYVYLVADHPVKRVDAVYVDGSRLLEGYTVHTGQAGDELAGYEGKAVLVFSSLAYVGRQFNVPRQEAMVRAIGIRAEACPLAWSSRELVDGSASSFALARGLDARPAAWVAFERRHGTVLGQEYSAEVENVSDLGVCVLLTVRREGISLNMRKFIVPPVTRTELRFWRGSGADDDELVLTPLDGQLKVYSITKTLTLDCSLEPEPTVSMELPALGLVPGRNSRLSSLGRRSLRADFSSGPQGTVRSERHLITLEEVTGSDHARIRLVAGDSTFKEAVIMAGKADTLSIVLEGGDWQTPTIVMVLSGEVSVLEIRKKVEYYPASSGPARESSGTSSARIVVGNDIRVDAALAVDTDGSYAGTGTLIERPDHVMRHFLINRMHFSAEDMDIGSFDASGDSYASEISGGYRYAFLLNAGSRSSDILMRMALEARSRLNCDRGKWELCFLPDTAPAPLKTIPAGDLAGEGAMFVFDRMPQRDLVNTLVGRYGFRSDNAVWEGVSVAADNASALKYGDRTRETELALIRDKATAESVLGHMLKQRATPLMTVTFPVFYEHFDLRVGDTIEIDNPLYGGRRFYIERIRRLDKFRAEIRAAEWWGQG